MMKQERKFKKVASVFFICCIMTVNTTSIGSVYAKGNNEMTLSSAENFHIFSNKTKLNAHVNGNVATRELIQANSNFGTSQFKNNGKGEISYIQKIDNIISSSWADPLVVGSDVKTESMDNGNAIGLQTVYGLTKLDAVKNIVVDDDYIDFDSEFANLRNVSIQIGNMGDTEGTVLDTSDFNHCVVTAGADGVNIITITADEFSGINELEIKDVNMETETVIVNIDMAGSSDSYNVNIKTYITDENGTTYHNREWDEFSKSRILWNFYDSTQGCSYIGSLTFQKSWMGSILAPNASIWACSNVDGSIMCDSFNNTGETHRWDFSGELPCAISDSADEDDGIENDEKNVPMIMTIRGCLDFGEETNLPEEVEVHLLSEEELVDTSETNEEKNWEYKFEDVPEFEEDGKTPIDYEVEVVLEENEWNVIPMNLEDGTVSFKLSRNIVGQPDESDQTTEIPEKKEDIPKEDNKTDETETPKEEEIPTLPDDVTKDNNNEYNYENSLMSICGELDFGDEIDLPDKVEVQLLSEDELIDSIETNEEKNWKYEFKEVPEFKEDGKTSIEYEVTVVLAEEWNTVTVTENGMTVFRITRNIVEVPDPDEEPVISDEDKKDEDLIIPDEDINGSEDTPASSNDTVVPDEKENLGETVHPDEIIVDTPDEDILDDIVVNATKEETQSKIMDDEEKPIESERDKEKIKTSEITIEEVDDETQISDEEINERTATVQKGISNNISSNYIVRTGDCNNFIWVFVIAGSLFLIVALTIQRRCRERITNR